MRLFNGELRRKNLTLRLLEDNARSFVQYLRRRKAAAEYYSRFVLVDNVTIIAELGQNGAYDRVDLETQA